MSKDNKVVGATFSINDRLAMFNKTKNDDKISNTNKLTTNNQIESKGNVKLNEKDSSNDKKNSIIESKTTNIVSTISKASDLINKLNTNSDKKKNSILIENINSGGNNSNKTCEIKNEGIKSILHHPKENLKPEELKDLKAKAELKEVKINENKDIKEVIKETKESPHIKEIHNTNTSSTGLKDEKIKSQTQNISNVGSILNKLQKPNKEVKEDIVKTSPLQQHLQQPEEKKAENNKESKTQKLHFIQKNEKFMMGMAQMLMKQPMFAKKKEETTESNESNDDYISNIAEGCKERAKTYHIKHHVSSDENPDSLEFYSFKPPSINKKKITKPPNVEHINENKNEALMNKFNLDYIRKKDY